MELYDVPILLVVFNKLESTKRVFNEIRRIKPKQLFVVSDGPRNKEEKKITDAVRKYILDNIDWPCKLRKIFRKENLGGDGSSIDALNWFFKNVEYGIFLEDDCLPSKSFFKYHRELLLKYKDNPRIKAITAVNFLPGYKIKESYIFSKIYFSCWGFSTWRRAWGIDADYLRKNYKSNLKTAFPGLLQRISVKRHMKKGLGNKILNWDYLFAAQNSLKGGLTIVPKNSVAENIGFDYSSTHSFNRADKKYLKVKMQEMDFPLTHPKTIADDRKINFYMELWLLKKYLERLAFRQS